ncbi:DUF4153 domain-containing protein [Ostreiculturibacter nitratireducens]|uniref:DUF4153 domain-containing protein n=1 Tax=Ostreiculturibacter nitratireducens TaxID=3075226 RepID=UPI0031B5CDCA
MGGNDTTRRQEIDRLRLAAFGALGGLCGWLLLDVYWDSGAPRLVLFLTVLAGGFFAAALAMAMHMRAARAAILSLAAALPPAVLMTWSSLRFPSVSDFLGSGHPLLAGFVLLALPVPFLMAREEGNWRDYARLFIITWNLVVRYAAVWIFTAVVWAVIYLSDTLLSLVGLDIIERLIEIPAVAWAVSGAAVGLGMAVVDELEDYVSPYLVLRLLRLLLPAVLIVVLVFLVSIPFRGLSDLFGNYSAAGTLMAIALAAVGLISIGVDASDDEMAGGAFMRTVVRALALTLPVLAALAAYAVWVRVADYGWTPSRIGAAAGVVVSAGYGLLYAGAVLSGAEWAGRIRGANVLMAGALVVLAALWLTPAVDAEGISARTQLARFEAGESTVEELPAWEMRWDWGSAGAAALQRLGEVQDHPEQAALEAKLAAVAGSTGRWDKPAVTEPGITLEVFQSLLTVRPEGAQPPEGTFDGIQPYQLREWIAGCQRTDAQGRAGCVLVVADFLPGQPGEEAMLFFRTAGRSVGTAEMAVRQANAVRFVRENRANGVPALGAEEFFDRLYSGDFVIGPAQVNALSFGSTEYLMLP